MKTLFATLIFFFSIGSTGYAKENIKIFNYSDFGPQIIAHEVIGMEWWQWDNFGNPSPGYEYEIKVVVFKDIALKKIMEMYPVNKSKQQDFRYLKYETAIGYLNEKINENILPEVTEILRKTRLELIKK